MMHHPNMHHQAISGHPPQHMGGHQGMPAHHQMPPHQMHRENRHVTLTRVGLGGGGGGSALGAHAGALGGLPAMPVPHHAPQRHPHPIRPMPHHPQPQHHAVPPQQMKGLRRPYAVGGAYGPGPGGAGVMPPPYAQPPPMQPPAMPITHTVVSTCSSTPTTNSSTSGGGTGSGSGGNASASGGGSTTGVTGAVSEPASQPAGNSTPATPTSDNETEESRPTQANSKEKTPMCLVNELARYNKIKHQYRLTSETGPAHKKVFTVTLRLGDTEEYTAEGSSIKRAQHAAAGAALSATRYPAPPPRAPHTAAPTHAAHRHAGAVMPTVELNALAMKLCQPAVYTSIPPVAGPTRLVRARAPAYRALVGGAYAAPALVYRVRVSVGGRAWLGEGGTPQAARHDAAARALKDLRPAADTLPHPPPLHLNRNVVAPPPSQDTDAGENGADLLNSEVKSPVSLVHELALKRNLSVQFTVKSERGPPHMRVFVTACTVGDMETEGEGNGKKVSKRRAAENMLEEMRRRWPPALLRPRPAHDKRRPQPTKKKPRNLIKEGSTGGAGAANGSGGADNPISRLAVARHAVRARSPQYRVLEERGAARRREFLVQCDAPPHSATGVGPNKKTAKRRAAHNVLLAMEMSAKSSESPSQTNACSPEVSASAITEPSTNGTDNKRKDGEVSLNTGSSVGGGNSEVRQPVPGVLLMDYHQRTGQPHTPNGVSETSATGGSGGNTPGAKDQLMYLSQLLGFTVQFSDFPKRNHGEYLSLVSLSTEPPVMCHGGGASTAHSHEQCSRAALRALALMGLDAPTPQMQTGHAGNTKTPVVSNGIAE